MAGQLVARGERTWLVRVYLGRDADGKRKYHNKTIHGNKKDAQAYLNKVLREKDLGVFVEPSHSSLNEYLDKWLDVAAKPRLREVTFASYRDLLRRYIPPHLGAYKLSQLTSVEVQPVYARLQEQGLSARTIRYVHSVLRNALSQAVKWRLLPHNPTELVDLPRQRRQEMRPLSPVEARAFLEAAREDRHGTLFELLLTTGLRPGEALGLKWCDVDFEAGRLHIQRSLVPGKGLQEPKTPRARRVVPLPASMTQSLRGHRKRQLEERLQAGADWQEQDLVFPGTEGQPLLHRNVVRRHFKPLLEKAGLPDTTRLYDLRHSCATLLLSAGENPKIVSERLGHASVTLTLDTYSHVLPDMQESAAAKLEGLLYDSAHKG